MIPPRRYHVALTALALLFATGCAQERASTEACREILDRIVELELREQGFRDPALALRKKAELHSVLAPDLRRCHGRRLPENALACVRGANSTEEISHTCLR